MRNLHRVVRILRAARATLWRWGAARIARAFRGADMAKLNDVADYILLVAKDAGEPVTNHKLQKLVYYAQAWSLALRHEALFGDKVKAWVHGPVVPVLYHRFKDFGSSPITFDRDDQPELSEDERGLVDEVLEVYLGISSWDLERLTHAEEPWLEARNGCAPDAASDAEISQDTMARFYKARSDAAEAAQKGD